MATELLSYRDHIGQQLDRIRGRDSHLTTAYRDRLHDASGAAGRARRRDRPQRSDQGSVDFRGAQRHLEGRPLRAHLDQFQEIMKDGESPGESWNSDAEMVARNEHDWLQGERCGDSREVVEIKATLEKIRELIQTWMRRGQGSGSGSVRCPDPDP